MTCKRFGGVSRNVPIDFLRIFFCFYIVVMHGEFLFYHIPADGVGRIFEGGYLGVEFFFFVTGYYLLADSSPNSDYFKKRLQKLYPHFLLSILLLAAIQGTGYDLWRIAINLLGGQLLFIDEHINGVLWFVVAEVPFVVLFRWLAGGGRTF